MSLPSGYKQLEYIQSSGSQYIDTSFKPNQNTRVVMEMEFPTAPTSDRILCGARAGSWGDRMFTITYVNSKSWWQFTYGSSYSTTSVTAAINTRFSVDQNKNVGTVNGVSSSATANTFTSSLNAFIFCQNNGGSASNFSSFRLFRFSMYDNGTLVRDFIPCQKQDGTLGLWDDVNSVFYGNAGTGTFTAGPIVVPLSEITELEYIESSGTQYVDTGFKPNNNSRVVLDFEPTASYSSIVGIFGTRDAKSGTAANMFVFWNNGINTFRTDYFGTQKTMTVSTILARQTVDKDKNVTTIGSVSVSNTVSTGQCSNNLYLFCTNNAGTAQYFAKLKLYSCQIYDNGTLIRDYIPAKLDDGTVGLYDKLNGLLYINAGTGTFISGGNVLNLPVNIGGDWKKANKAFVNIGGTWKTVKDVFVNIGGAWKKIG